ncbi:MAG: ParA family protein [Peptostreptococcaceae bacterium]|nr:ParA family protein [Peptostreptococcaceae bacterium]
MATIKLEKTCVLAIANSKGGSGKSTTASMLARSLGERNYKVLVIDCDSQMDLTNTLGFTVDESLVEFGLTLTDFNKTIYQLIRQKGNPKDFIVKTKYRNLDLIAGDDYIGRIEFELHHEFQRETVLKKIMQELIDEKRYDFIIFDTSTHLGDLAANILNITDKVIIPVPMAMFGIRGIRTFIDFFNQFTQMNPNLEIMGILMTMYRHNNKIINERAENLLLNIFGRELLFRTKISIDANIEKAQWNNVTAYEFAPKTRAATQYKDLTKEVIKRVKG